jgi:deazaflavin-dependent oxidoreductase (nitroreductase family)
VLRVVVPVAALGLAVRVATAALGRERLRGLATRRFNPVVIGLGLVGGERSPWGYLEHVGRKSGRVYRTPVLPMFAGEFAYLPLTFGPDADWARNVHAAGACRLQVHETVYELDEPSEIPAAEHPAVPEALRPLMERRGRRYVRLHVASRRPGRLGDRPVVQQAGGPVHEPVVSGPPALGRSVRARSRAAAFVTRGLGPPLRPPASEGSF